MNELNDFKSKITFENKTIFGIVGLVIAIFFWGIGHPNIGIMDVLILVFPAIFLIIPNETIKNSKPLAIIAAIIIGLLLLVGISSFITVITEYMPYSYMFTSGYVEGMFIADILQIILAIYGLFCAFLMTIPTMPNSQTSSNNNNIGSNQTNSRNFCSSCGAKLNQDAKFCSSCGEKVE